MSRALSLSTLLFAIWLIWSGHYTPLLLAFGVLSCALVLLVSHRMRIIDPEGHPIHLVRGSLSYGLWLTWALVQSNVDLAKRVLSPSLPIAPRMIRVKASQKTHLGQVIYANSITLTPGTVSVDIEDGMIEATRPDCRSGARAHRRRNGPPRHPLRKRGLMFIAAMIGVLITMLMALVRALSGPTVFDRILAVNMFGTKTVLFIAVLGFLSGRPEFLDLALVYVLINFIGTIAILKFVRFGKVETA